MVVTSTATAALDDERNAVQVALAHRHAAMYNLDMHSVHAAKKKKPSSHP